MTIQDFFTTLPTKVNPEAIADANTNFHFDLDASTLQKTIKIEDGKMTVSDGLIGAPDCTVTAKSDLLMRILNKEENPMMAMMMGKIKISNLNVMMKFAKILGLM